MGIKKSRRWTPTLEINTNTKIAKIPRKDGQTDRGTYYTTTWGILTRGLRLHALRAITGRDFMISKKQSGRPERDIDIELEIQTEIQTDT